MGLSVKRAAMGGLISLGLLFSSPAFCFSVADDDAFCAPYQYVPVEVTPVFEEAQLDTSLSLRQLQNLTEDPRRILPTTETVRLGITHYSPMVRFSSSIVKKPMQDGSFCARVERVKVSIGYKDVVISVANDFLTNPCAFDHVLTHERKHVQANEALLDSFLPEVSSHLSAVLRENGTFRVATEELAENLVRQRLHAELEGLSSSLLEENRRRQAFIDTPQEYATNQTACGGAVQEITRRGMGR